MISIISAEQPRELYGVDVHLDPYLCTLMGDYVQRRRHRRPRIDKKWRRFGKRMLPCPGRAMTNPFLSGYVLCPHSMNALKKALK